MDDAQYMRRALALAERARGRVEPNPVVGCVLVRGGTVVGEGWHRRFGGPHAEVEALEKAGNKARGATAYVTLEPCCHFGKTPPCSDALIAAGVKRVVAACIDPFPRVKGGGVKALRKAGIAVETGLMKQEAGEINAPFFKRVGHGLPYVIAKWAATLDGATATSSGDSRWVSGEESRRVVHELRARVDAVLIGIGTALADDPLLTARGVKLKRVARRVVIDPALRLPMASRLVASVAEAPLTIAVTGPLTRTAEKKRMALEKRGVEVVTIPTLRGGTMNLTLLLKYLAQDHAVTNLLAEGGAATLALLHAQRLIDEWLVFIAPKIFGDGAGVPIMRAVPGLRAVQRMAEATPLRLVTAQRLGSDVMLRYRTAGG
jgi:diaminohydroxyphosphoribosylaminopyrimidine deaminase/5-amino-6-(5-phosphoribosylamino)uracil reductase